MLPLRAACRSAGRSLGLGLRDGRPSACASWRGRPARPHAAGSGEPDEKPRTIRDGTWPRFLAKDAIYAGDGFPRFLAVVPGIMVTLSIGSVYAWSLWNLPLMHELGVVASAAADWSLKEVVGVFSVATTALGFTTFFLGPWAERAGPRYSAAVAASSFGTGLALCGLACYMHQLPLLYLGFGVFGGIGWGLGYISPVSTMLRWFPDRRGMAGGFALVAFGGGGALAAPLISCLQNHFAIAPTFLGAVDKVPVLVDHGVQFSHVDGLLREVVVATAADLAKLSGPLSQLHEGVYLVGTGSTGAGMAFLSLGAFYSALMGLGACAMRVPKPGWAPAGFEGDASLLQDHGYTYKQAMTQPQFYLLWTVLFGNVCGGMAIMGSAKTMICDVFGQTAPGLVSGGFAASYVAALSVANAAGRVGWSTTSDYIGRKNTYKLFATGIPVLASVPFFVIPMAVDGAAGASVGLFVGSTMFVIMNYGGVFACLPAYISDLFGQRNVGAIHGRILTAWTAAALTGPSIMTHFRAQSERAAIEQLAANLSESQFAAAFGGASPADLPQLVERKTVTISRLMELQASGTFDPTPHLYDTTCYTICGCLALAAMSNLLIKPPGPPPQIAAVGLVEKAIADVASTITSDSERVLETEIKGSSQQVKL